jgi:hypothetical protein
MPAEALGSEGSGTGDPPVGKVAGSTAPPLPLLPMLVPPDPVVVVLPDPEDELFPDPVFAAPGLDPDEPDPA